jgi:hypothetical protein
LLSGLKLWVLFPPNEATFSTMQGKTWFETEYFANTTNLPYHYRFVQEPGDIVFVPDQWGHAVLNLADSVAMAFE